MRRSAKNPRRGTLKSYIADPFFIVGRNLQVTYINETGTDLIGYTKEEVIGTMTYRDIFQDDVREAIERCIETGEPVENRRVMVKDRQGRQIPWRTHAALSKRFKDRVLVVFKPLALA